MIAQCHSCRASVFGIERGKYFIMGDPLAEVRFMLLECPNCSEPILTREKGTPQMMGKMVEIEWSELDQLYPVGEFRINPNIPELLRDAFNETIRSYNAETYTAAVIMCRRTLDGFCAEKGATKKSLYANLKELKEKDLINDQLYDWADLLRISGNEAAHDVTISFSKEDARDLLEFTVAILDFSYSIQSRYVKFVDRKADKLKSEGEASSSEK